MGSEVGGGDHGGGDRVIRLTGRLRRVTGPGRRSQPRAVGSLLAVAGSGTLSTLCALGLLGTSAWLITRASQRPPVLDLAVAIGLVQAFALGRGLSRYAQRLTTHAGSLATLSRLRVWLFDVLEPLVPNGLPGRGSAAVLNGFVADAESCAEGLAASTTAAVDAGSSIVVGTLILGLLSPGPAAVLLAGSAAAVGLSVVITHRGSAAAARAAAVRADIADSVVEAVRTAPEMLVLGQEDLVSAQLARAHARAWSAARGQALARGGARAAATWAAGAGLVGVLLAGLAAHQAGQLSGVMLAVTGLVGLAVLDQCAALPVALAASGAGDVAAARLLALERLTPPVREPSLDRGGEVNGSGAVLAGVEVGMPDPAGGLILDDVSLSVAPGRRVALVGPSGAGKTSVLHVLLHFLEPVRGSATLGGVEVRHLGRPALAEHEAWLAEETHVFAATLRDNLTVGRASATEVECTQALERVGLGAWFASLPGGLATVLGAGGRGLSAGERQRLGMARAILSTARLLLLDEPTAHLDPESSPEALGELVGAAGSRSVLVVSHEAGVAALVDTVVDLEGGRVTSVRDRPIAPSGEPT
jgi:ATP-binding cassette subfamily C protein CydC